MSTVDPFHLMSEQLVLTNQTLKFQSGDLSDHDTARIASFLRSPDCPQGVIIDLTDVNISDNGLRLLTDAIKANTTCQIEGLPYSKALVRMIELYNERNQLFKAHSEHLPFLKRIYADVDMYTWSTSGLNMKQPLSLKALSAQTLVSWGNSTLSPQEAPQELIEYTENLRVILEDIRVQLQFASEQTQYAIDHPPTYHYHA